MQIAIVCKSIPKNLQKFIIVSLASSLRSFNFTLAKTFRKCENNFTYFFLLFFIVAEVTRNKTENYQSQREHWKTMEKTRVKAAEDEKHVEKK